MPAEPRRDGGASPRDERLETVLAAQPARILRALSEEERRDADPVVRRDEPIDAEASVTLCYELHHVVLPGLEAAGLVEFDRRGDEVRRGERYDQWRTVLDRADGGPDEVPPER
jgi:hypothetical protein